MRPHLPSNARSNAYSNARSNAYSNARSNAYSNARCNAYSNARCNAYSNARCHAFSSVHGKPARRAYRKIARIAAFAAAAAIACSPAAPAQDLLTLAKVDPPNWYATLPRPMLLIRGTGLACAHFSLSDTSLAVERTEHSANGHWAQVYLSASPSAPETVTLRATCSSGAHAETPYTFAAPRAAASGMAGFAPRDVLYLIVTDRFADGDLTNDGPQAQDSATSAAAVLERAQSRGWHGGDLRGITAHLDYIQQLGATAVWTTPVYQNHAPQAYHGYHATDHYAVDEHYGSMQDLQTLSAALHARGMKLLLDTVPNHVGPRHPWVTDPPAPDWLHGTLAHHIAGETNFDALINPHAPDRDREATLHGWFVDSLPDMNTESPAVAQYLRQNAVWWIEQTGADALRIDTFPYVDRPFWHAYMEQLHALFPQLTEVGEISNADPEITSAFAGGVTRAGVDTGLYTPFDFPLFFAMRDVFGKGASFARAARVLEADELYPHPERLVPFLGNHDTGRLADAVHDPADRRRAFGMLLTTRGTPQLYAGDELGMLGADDPENRADFPGGFPVTSPGQAQNAFVATTRTPAQAALMDWIAALGQLRRQSSALSCGAEQVLTATQDAFVYARLAGTACPGDPRNLIVVITRGQPHPFTLDLRQTAVAACRPGKPLLGTAEMKLDHMQLTLESTAGFAILPCN